MRSKADKIALSTGDAVHIETPGGGGFGDPLKRQREEVRRDLVKGFISRDIANNQYGYKD